MSTFRPDRDQSTALKRHDDQIKALHNGKQARKGLGIIADDVQVRSLDGSRLLKDSARPRVEITISTFDEEPIQESMLFAAEEPAEAPPIVPPAKIVPAKLPSRGLLTPDDPDY